MLRISVADETEAEDVIGVPIEREQLFEVDVRTMTVNIPESSSGCPFPETDQSCDSQLKPVYWQTSGPKIQVMRSIWMFDEVYRQKTTGRKLVLTKLHSRRSPLTTLSVPESRKHTCMQYAIGSQWL